MSYYYGYNSANLSPWSGYGLYSQSQVQAPKRGKSIASGYTAKKPHRLLGGLLKVSEIAGGLFLAYEAAKHFLGGHGAKKAPHHGLLSFLA